MLSFANVLRIVKNRLHKVYHLLLLRSKRQSYDMNVQTQQILHKMRAHTFCSDTESNLILFTYYFVTKGIKSSVLFQDP